MSAAFLAVLVTLVALVGVLAVVPPGVRSRPDLQ